MQQLFKLLYDIEDLAGYTTASVGVSEEWADRAAEDNRESYSVAFRGKTLYSALNGTYTVTLNEFKSLMSSKAGQLSQGDGFKEVRSQKDITPQRQPALRRKQLCQLQQVRCQQKKFFAPFRANNMDTDAPVTVSNPTEATAPEKLGQPLPIMLTSAANLIQLQKQLKGVAKQNFEFRSTRNGTRVVTKDMVDCQAVKTSLNNHSLSYYTFYPKADKPINAVIRHLPINAPAEGIAEGLVDIGFDVIIVKQMSSVRRSLDGFANITLPLFLVALPKTIKSSELFKLSSLCHISIKVEAYKSQNTLSQCFNCQKFGHVWANCRQPPRCLSVWVRPSA
jgi:hypothetical protein